MTLIDKIDPNASRRPATAAPIGRTPDDTAMLRAAADLPRDLLKHRAGIYWPDFLASALIGYAGLAGAILSRDAGLAFLCALVAMVALFRAASFIHELTHIRAGALPGFRFAWNLLVGVPLLIPSFLYEEVHTHHHARTRYGTAEDPEYLPLALMKPWSLPLFLMVSLLAPVALLARFAVLAPLGFILPPLRKIIVARYSGLAINPSYQRRAPEGAFARMWRWQETAASLWAIGLLIASALYGWRPLLIGMAIFSGVALVNQVRTLVAHLWENEGEPMTVTGQYLNSVNVPALVSVIWAPVGLRYHAIHHLLPSMPYHSLATAHRTLMVKLGDGSTYHRANHAGMVPLMTRIARSTMGRR